MGIAPDTAGNTPVTAGATSASVDITAAAVGAVVYCWASISTSSTTQTGVPGNAGWAALQSAQTAAGTSGATYALSRRVKQSGDTTFSFTWTTSGKGIFAWASYTGVDTGTPDEQSTAVQLNDTTARTAVPGPSATPTAGSRWALACFGVRTTTAGNKPISWTPDAATTERADADNNAAASAAWLGAEIADSNGAVTQAAHSYTATHNASESHDGSVLLFLIPAAAAAAVPAQAARRTAARVPALPPVRRYRQLLPVPVQLNPPFGFTEIAQRRETWPRALPRRGHVTFAVAPQVNPPYPAAVVRQQRQLRGLFPRRGHGFAPVPAQQAAPGAPTFVWQQLRHPRLAAAARHGRLVAVPPAQAPAAAPPWTGPHRVPARAAALICRRFRQLLPWPQATGPAFTVGALTAGTQPTATLTAGTASAALTAATAPTAAFTAETDRTGGPS